MDDAALPCHRCGYDLRATPAEGVCPECGEPVAESRRLHAVPRRPIWRDSDPRWRRRMVAGAWVLVLVPLVEALRRLGLAERVPVPTLPGFETVVGSLNETFLIDSFLTAMGYPLFPVGIALLFSKERDRRHGRLDWTRRWGVFGSYLVLLLGVTTVGLVMALVAIGCAALFFTLPPKDQPIITGFLADAGAAYIYYGPQDDTGWSWAVLSGISSAVVLLACAPLYDALRSAGPRWAAVVVLAPLALIAAAQVGFAVLHGLELPVAIELPGPLFYFEPSVLLEAVPGMPTPFWASPLPLRVVEVVKWLAFLTIAVWLTAAQAAAWRRRP